MRLRGTEGECRRGCEALVVAMKEWDEMAFDDGEGASRPGCEMEGSDDLFGRNPLPPFLIFGGDEGSIGGSAFGFFPFVVPTGEFPFWFCSCSIYFVNLNQINEINFVFVPFPMTT